MWPVIPTLGRLQKENIRFKGSQPRMHDETLAQKKKKASSWSSGQTLITPRTHVGERENRPLNVVL